MSIRWLAAALLVVVVAPRALAQEVDDATRSAARDLASEGSDLYQAGSFDEAYDRFSRAYQLVRVPTLGIWAARSLVKLGRLVEASERFLELERQTLAEGAPPEHQKAKDDAALERQALLPRIPSVRVLLDGAAPSEVFITLNGELVPAALVGAKRPVNPGTLKIQGTRGSQIVEATIELGEGESRDVKLQFQAQKKPAPVAPLAPVAPSGPPPLAVSDADAGSSQRTLGYVALGVGGAGLVVGSVFGALGLSAQSDLDDDCPNRACRPDHYGDLDAYESKRTISMLGFVGGAAFAATGAVLLLTVPDGGTTARGEGRKSASAPRFGAFVGIGGVQVFGVLE